MKKNRKGIVLWKSMGFDEEEIQIQKKIDWISNQIRETKIQLNREYKDLKDALKEQEKIRNKK